MTDSPFVFFEIKGVVPLPNGDRMKRLSETKD